MLKQNDLNIFTWKDVYNAAKKTATMIIGEHKKPNLIVGIPRGGMIYSTLLAELLDLDLLSLYVSRRESGKEVRKSPIIRYDAPDNIGRQKILLVDEICVTGETLILAKRKLLALGVTSVDTCVIVNRSCGQYSCNYTYFFSDRDNNIFPWDYLTINEDGSFAVHREYAQLCNKLKVDLYDLYCPE